MISDGQPSGKWLHNKELLSCQPADIVIKRQYFQTVFCQTVSYGSTVWPLASASAVWHSVCLLLGVCR